VVEGKVAYGFLMKLLDTDSCNMANLQLWIAELAKPL